MSYLLKLGDSREILAGMKAGCVDALVCDPPAGIAFMGKEWDHDHGGREGWVKAFASIFAECFRVMKPGAHGLVWALPRTSHWTATALEDAGFEIRDVVMHLFGTGFPKSLNVSKAIDGVNAEVGRLHRFTAWLRTTGIAASRINEVTGTFMGSHYLTPGSQPAIPTPELWAKLRPFCTDVPSWVDDLVARIAAEREVTGIAKGAGSCNTNSLGEFRSEYPATLPATAEAIRFDGFGTALKPAAEHWILVRKPLIGTVAENALAHGCGGLNIAGCRVAAQGPKGNHGRGGPIAVEGRERTSGFALGAGDPQDGLGRWPAHLVLDEEAAAMLDEQSGELTARGNRGGTDGSGMGYHGGTEPGRLAPAALDSGGGASRFFYVAKAPKSERNGGLNGEFPKGNDHPTVKAVALMQWLVRLITPPGGVVLDPFMGSGSTGIAALAEGFHFIGIEREEHYMKIAEARIAHATESEG